MLSAYAIVPDTSLTQPANACYQLTVTDNFNRPLGTYPCLQPQGSTWSFDAFVPSSMPAIPALTLPQFKTNGTLNSLQGLLNIACTGCTYSAGTVTIPVGAGSRTTTLVATGTSDQTQINAAYTALNAAGGGKIILSPGHYVLSTPIAPLSNVFDFRHAAGAHHV